MCLLNSQAIRKFQQFQWEEFLYAAVTFIQILI